MPPWRGIAVPEGDVVAAALSESIALHERVRQADPRPVIEAATAIVESLRRGGKLLLFGNGGSAAQAQHVAAELVGRFQRERAGIGAMALTADAAVLTSLGNDYTFDRVFARQVEALGRPVDVAFGISTSGDSPNVVAALVLARDRGLRTIALTGRTGGEAGRAAEIHLNVSSESTPRIQEVHLTLLHTICDLVERALASA